MNKTKTLKLTDNFRLLTLSEAANELGISRTTLNTWIKVEKDFPTVKYIRDRPYLSRAELQTWILTRPAEGGSSVFPGESKEVADEKA